MSSKKIQVFIVFHKFFFSLTTKNLKSHLEENNANKFQLVFYCIIKTVVVDAYNQLKTS